MMTNIQHRVATGLVKWYMEKRGFKAWTSFWSVIYYIDEGWMKVEWLQRHEMKHVEQINRMGKLKFAVCYMVEDWLRGYWNNKYEVEARAAEKRGH